jgi:hypothetical protein
MLTLNIDYQLLGKPYESVDKIMVEKKKGGESAGVGMTRRDFIVASFAATAGLAVGGRLGRELFPKVVETPGPVVTMTTTKTEQTTQTVTQTVLPPGPPKRQLPEVKIVDKPVYERYVVGPVERFDQKNIIFSRIVWDEEYIKRRAAAPLRPVYDEMAELEGSAFDASGWYVHRKAGASGNVGPGGLKYKDLYDWNMPISKVKFPVPDPAKMSERIKYVAKFLGADLVGICELDQRWVYSHYYDRNTKEYGELNVPYKYAIAIAIEMDWKEIKTSPAWEASAATGLGYSKMAFIAPSLAAYINGLGYPAIPAGNDVAQSIPIAIDAGLGEFGRHGLLITPEFGPRVRLCKVLTDLPLQPDKPIEFGVQGFCESKCGELCAKACPAQAIAYGPNRVAEGPTISERKGILRWAVNHEKCHIFWSQNRTDCSNCVAVCPWGV